MVAAASANRKRKSDAQGSKTPQAKRKSAGGGGEPERRTLFPQSFLQDAFDQGCEGLKMSTQINEDCRNMLVGMAPHSLGIPQEERTKIQTMAVDMMGEALEGVAARLKAAADTVKEAEAGAQAAREVEVQKVKAAEAAVARAKEGVDEKRAAMLQASQATLSAKKALADRQQEQKAGTLGGAQAKQDLQCFEAHLSGEFKMLVEGGWETQADAKKLFEALEGTLKKIGLEESMMAALPGAIGKGPSERGHFDRMVFQQCQEKLEAKVEELKRHMEEFEPAEAQRAAAVPAAQSALDGALKAQAARDDEHTAERAKHREALAGLKAAQDGLEGTSPACKSAEAAIVAADAEFENFKKGALEGYKTMRAYAPAAATEAGSPQA